MTGVNGGLVVVTRLLLGLSLALIKRVSSFYFPLEMWFLVDTAVFVPIQDVVVAFYQLRAEQDTTSQAG